MFKHITNFCLNHSYIVLIDEKPYYLARDQRFYSTGEELKTYLYEICKNEQDYKITQQDRLVYENVNQSKKVHIGYSIFLNILFTIGAGKQNIATGLIRPTLNEQLEAYNQSFNLENAERFWNFARDKLFISNIDYVSNFCDRFHGCPKCKPQKLLMTPPDIHRLFTNYELNREPLYDKMCENIYKSMEKFSTKQRFQIILDSTKTCPISLFKHYVKWHYNTIVNPQKEKSNVIESKFESIKQLQESMKQSEKLESVVKYMYLRSIYKDDKEHVVEMDRILDNKEDIKESNRLRDLYQKLCYEVSSGDRLVYWDSMKYDYKCYPVKLFLDTHIKNCFY